MKTLPHKGDAVAWQTSQGETSGTVDKIVKRTTTIKGHVAKATAADPQVVVKSERLGKKAVHSPAALKKT